MTTCALCKKSIGPGIGTVSIVGGMFPRDDPEFFVVDEQVLKESYAHLTCLLDAFAGKTNASTPPDPG